jgi:hypothetical protein
MRGAHSPGLGLVRRRLDGELVADLRAARAAAAAGGADHLRGHVGLDGVVVVLDRVQALHDLDHHPRVPVAEGVPVALDALPDLKGARPV